MATVKRALTGAVLSSSRSLFRPGPKSSSSPREVIVAAGGHISALAARDATREIPISFTTVTDPVKDGLVQSLNKPGGNGLL
jgi:ABC-type uncharacterized transport system substrate-binding protein